MLIMVIMFNYLFLKYGTVTWFSDVFFGHPGCLRLSDFLLQFYFGILFIFILHMCSGNSFGSLQFQ